MTNGSKLNLDKNLAVGVEKSKNSEVEVVKNTKIQSMLQYFKNFSNDSLFSFTSQKYCILI